MEEREETRRYEQMTVLPRKARQNQTKQGKWRHNIQTSDSSMVRQLDKAGGVQ